MSKRVLRRERTGSPGWPALEKQQCWPRQRRTRVAAHGVR